MINNSIRQLLNPLTTKLPFIWSFIAVTIFLYVVFRLITKIVRNLRTKIKKPIKCRECSFNWVTYDEVLSHVNKRKDEKKSKLNINDDNSHK